MVGQRKLKRLTVGFAVISALLWTADYLVHSNLTCDMRQRRAPKVYFPDRGVEHDISNVSNWFSRELKKYFDSPPEPMCHPITSLAGSNNSYSLIEKDLNNNFDYFGTLAALGNIRIAEIERLTTVVEQLSNVTKIVQAIGPGFSSLYQANIDKHNTATREAIDFLVHGGVSLISVANPAVSSLVASSSVKPLITTLEASRIHWLGLTAKSHHIAVVGGQRVGFIAMCASHGQCVQLSGTPFAPVKYTYKVATSMVNNVKEYGVEVIVLLLSWGRESGTHPDETILSIARKMAHLGVTVIVGYGPNAIQDHAYFGSTLVIFSMGNLVDFGSNKSYCWRKESGEWLFAKNSDHCKIIHPMVRDSLLERETSTRIYKLHLSRSQPAVTQYITLPLTVDETPTHKLRTPLTTSDGIHQWSTVCGPNDRHCLSCKPF